MITALSTLIIIGGIFVYLVAGYIICFFLNNHGIIDICKTDFNNHIEPDESMLMLCAIFFPLVLGYVIIKKSSYFIINLFIDK
jgi:hypothetical protein